MKETQDITVDSAVMYLNICEESQKKHNFSKTGLPFQS